MTAQSPAVAPIDLAKADRDTLLLPFAVRSHGRHRTRGRRQLSQPRPSIRGEHDRQRRLPGIAVAGAPDCSISASILAIAAFLVGALAGGRLGSSMAEHRAQFFAIAILVKLGLVGAAFVCAIAMVDGELLRNGLIVLLALAMGLQNAAARFLAIPDLTTTVLTLTLTGLAADSTLAGGSNPRAWSRASE